jgi:hypothetical protein
MSNISKYQVTTFTKTGSVYKIKEYKTKASMNAGVTRQNLEYGAHLGRKVTEVLTDGSIRQGYCFA